MNYISTLDSHRRQFADVLARKEQIVQKLLRDLTKPWKTAEDVEAASAAAGQLQRLPRELDRSWAILITFDVTRPVLRCFFGLIRRYRLWLNHEVWWLP